MTPERWQRIRELFYAAYERNPDERAAYLGTECAADPSLRRDVEQLISSHERANSFLEPTETTLPAAESQPVLHPSQRVGHYRIIEAIGQGGMGVVYKAEDSKLGRLVALKFLPSVVAEDSQALERFRREARAASALNHPNVCTIHAIEEDEGRPFIVMELLHGQTLAACIAGQPLATARLVELSVQIADALQAAHEQGITHRDIKPGNIFVTDRGQVKILDFGLARIMATRENAGDGNPSSTQSATDANSPALTKPGGIVGTIPYLSPEQLRGEQPDSRSDLFSFGTVLYEMATGRPAFSGSQETTVEAILNREPPSPRLSNPDLPSELEWIVTRALEKKRELRYQSAADVKADLLRIGRGADLIERSTTSSRRPRLVRRWATILTSAIVLTAAVAAALWKARDRAELVKADAPPLVRSIAVLPLENLTGDASQEYFVDGMTDALITELAQISALQVISRTSALRYKGEKKSVSTIAQELGVDAVVEGTVARSGNRVRIDAQLVHAASDRHLWARSFDRDLGDVMALQSEMAGAIATEIQTKLTPQGQARLAKTQRVNPAAYEAYLKGRFLLNRWSVEEANKALPYFREALAIDPKYAQAHAGLSDSYITLALFSGPKPEAWERARAAATRALELDDTLAEAHRALASVRLRHDWDVAGGEREHQRALQLNPSDAETYKRYSHLLQFTGRLNEALAMMKRAQELDPLSPEIAMSVAGAYYLARQYDQAIEQAQKAIELEPTFVNAHRWLGSAYEAKGKFSEAIAEFQMAVKLSPGNLSYLGILARGYAVAGNKTEAWRTMAKLKELAKTRYVSPLQYAHIYAALGEKDQAFSWLEKAFEERNSALLGLSVSPLFDPLRSDPRFAEFVRRIEATAKLTRASKDSSAR